MDSQDRYAKLTDEEIERLVSIAIEINRNSEICLANEAEDYVLKRGVKEGDTNIPTYVIYNDYLLWAEKPICRDIFFKQFSKLFKPRNGMLFRYYKLDPAQFDLSRDTFFKIRKRMREEKAKRAAKLGKISRARQKPESKN